MAASDPGSFVDARVVMNDSGQRVLRVTWNIDSASTGTEHLGVPYPDARGVPQKAMEGEEGGEFWPTGDPRSTDVEEGEDGTFTRTIEPESESEGD